MMAVGRKAIGCLIILLHITVFGIAQDDRDTTVVARQRSDRGVMLNAEAASVPREVSIGLPTGEDGAYIAEDGLLVAWGISKPYYTWSGGNSYAAQPLMNLMEGVVKTGSIGYVIDSRTRYGGDLFSAILSARTSINGLINFDGYAGGALGKGWYYSAGAFINYDPTSVNAPGRTFVDRKNIFKATVSKRWRSGEWNLTYKFAMCGDSNGGYNVAPFIYNGDGTISMLDGFRIGKDCYMPEDDNLNWLDLNGGRARSEKIGKIDERYFHNIRTNAIFNLSGWNVEAILYATLAPKMNSVKMTSAGVDNVLATAGYTLPDGTAYSGYVQQRLASIAEAESYVLMGAVHADSRMGLHKLGIGVDLMYNHQYESTSSANFAHEAKANPRRLKLNGRDSWALNTNSLFFTDNQWAVVTYAVDKWNITKRLIFNYGLRLRLMGYNCLSAFNPTAEDSFNSRYDGFYIGEGKGKLMEYGKTTIDGALSAGMNWNVLNGLTLIAEGFYSLTSKGPTSMRGAVLPVMKHIGNAMARGGISYSNPWIDIAAMFSYVTFWNNYKNVSVTKQIGGMNETQTVTAQYGVGTLGFTVDGNIHFGGFNMHALCTLQDPRYKDYDNEFTFSDGSRQTISYTGKILTGVSRVELELDPSYSYRDWKFWLSARYFSRQYASRTNLAYFKGHWETFGGVDWNVIKNLKLSLNFVNMLFQSGAKGSLDVADTIDNAEELVGYALSGTYMRPFSVEFGVSLKF